jgi:hypothetical protein
MLEDKGESTLKNGRFKRALSMFLTALLLLSLLPTMASADNADSFAAVESITVLEPGPDITLIEANTITQYHTYTARLEVQNNRTYTISPSVTLYEVRAGQSDKTVGTMDAVTIEPGAASLDFSWKPAATGAFVLKAVVAGADGESATAEQPVTVSYPAIGECAEQLVSYYQTYTNGSVTGIDIPLGPLAMRSLTDSKSLGGAAVNVPYYGADSYFTHSYVVIGSQAKAIIDCIAAGKNPKNYDRATAGSGEIVKTDLIQELLDLQNRDDGSLFSTSSGRNYKENPILSVLALDAYYGNQDWGNEETGTQLGRKGAIEYFLSQIRPFIRTTSTNYFNVADGYAYVDTQQMALYSGNIPNPMSSQWSDFALSQSFAVALLTRFKNDDTVVTYQGEEKPLREIVAPLIAGIMKVMDAMYAGDQSILNCTAANAATGKGYMTQRTYQLMPYVSALIAVGRTSDIDAEMLGYLHDLRLENGTFKNALTNTAMSAANTALAAIAIGDLVNNRSILSSLSFSDSDVGDEEAVKFALADLALPEAASGNLTLSTVGTFGCAVAWRSSNADVINPETGAVARPAVGQPDANVILTATVSRGSVSDTRTFYVLVPALESNDDRSVVTADTQCLIIPLFVTESIALPTTGASGLTSISWQSTEPGAVTNDGTVTRGAAEQKVTLTATVSKGDAVQTRAFNITVGKTYDPSDIITDAVYKLRAQYNTDRTLTNNYWEVWAAKAVLGDAFTDYGFSVYNVKNHRQSSAWQGTDYGAVVLQILAQGDNPYNYLGTDYVALLKDYIVAQPDTSPWGPWANSIYQAMALDAAGAAPPEGVEYPISQLLGFTKSLGSGPDMAGWAMIPVATHIEEAKTLAVGEGKTGLELLQEFRTALIAKQFSATWNNPMLGEIRTNTNKRDDDGISYTMSNACVVMGAMALVNAGLDEFDLRTSDAWKKRSTNMTGGAYVYASPADALYKQEIQNKTTFNTQISIAFGDMFYGDSVYRRIAVQPEDLTALAAEAAVVIGSAAAYTGDSFAAFTEAYNIALTFIDGASVKPAFGKAYFTLLDAYENLKPAGSVAVRVLGGSDVLYDTKYVASTGNVLDVLGKYAIENSVSQTSTTSAVQEIGGLKGEWRVYNGEVRVTDLTAPLAEGSVLTFKYPAAPSVIPETATLDEQLVRETAATLTVAETVTENIPLPSSGAFGTTITWQSSNPLYINASGVVKRALDDVAVTLTATVSGPKGTSLDLQFNVVVKGTNPSETQKYAWISVTDPNPPSGRPSVYYSRQKLEIAPGETAFTLLQKTGLTLRVNPNTQYGVYVEAIEGYGEFDDGPYSGWVCLVNGAGITKSSALISLNDGDSVEWLYTRDLGRDVGISWEDSNDPSHEPSIITPKVTVVDGVAAVTVSADDITAAIAEVKENGGADIIIIPEISGGVPTKVTVKIPRDSLLTVVTQTTVNLTIQTPVGTVTFPKAALDSITSQAPGSTVTISLETVDNATLTADQQKAVGTNAVYDISVLSGNTKISSFGGNSISISLPYTLKDGESASGVTVWYMDDSGKLQQMTAVYDKATGMATFSTTHLSYYLVSYIAPWTNLFTDVKTTDWFYDAVMYVSQNNLMSGTSKTIFEPNATMTRAMLVTVLYRLEGKPSITGTSGFSDVKSGEWYTDAVTWASANKIIGGYDGGFFGATDSVTREQLAVMLMNYAAYKKYDTTKTTELETYTDAASIDSWGTAAVKWAVAEDLITGTTTTTLSPTGTASRAQVATILMRFIENVAK